MEHAPCKETIDALRKKIAILESNTGSSSEELKKLREQLAAMREERDKLAK